MEEAPAIVRKNLAGEVHRKKIAEAGHPDTVIVVVTNGKDDKSLKKNI